ncbi:unnamed protein product [Closterium sp. Naga37s-1]|nr:unnamed protein product [Closterium sp. Naga37s-1]
MNNTAAGHIAIRLWCIPPPRAASSPPPSAAAPTGATQASSESPPASSSWHQLAGCVQRFPPPTHLLCLPRRCPASPGGKIGNVGGRQASGQACSRVGMGSAKDRQKAGGRLEEVREWVEGACAVREEGEWMVVVACEDTGGGIPPEEMQWVLDPHGLAYQSPHEMHSNGQHKVMERIRSLGRAESWKGLGRADSWKGLGRQRERSTWDPLQRDRKAAAGPRWTPYPVRFLLSTSLVAEMRGGMAVLSDASTGTTILLALPMGGGDNAGSKGEENGEKFGELEGADEERESGTQEELASGAPALTRAAAASVQPAPPPPQRPAAGARRALVRAQTCPQVELERGMGGGEGVGEAERVVRGAVAGRRVAVVDDNAVNRMVARRTLQGYGAHVLLLCSGEDALQALSSATPSPPIHLLLLDLHMPPGIDGSVPC